MADDLVQKLWDGVDLIGGELDQVLDESVRATAVGSGGAETEGGMRLQILGPPDTGTNLIAVTVLKNFLGGGSVHNLDDLLFKHSVSNAKDICERYLSQPVHENFTVAVAIRSPMSQLASWVKAPYALWPCIQGGVGEMGKPCFANTSPEWNDLTLNKKTIFKYYPGLSVKFKNTMDVYNRYLKQYKGMLSEPACRKLKVQLIRYEDMVFTPEEVMKELAQKTGWRMPATLAVVDAAAKGSGAPVGRSGAQKKINQRTYLQAINATVLAALCQELDADLVRDQFEKSFSKAPVSYLKDCQ